MLWIFSIVAFLGVLLYVYVSLPQIVSINTNVSAINNFILDKGNVFYLSLSIFIISNLSWYLLSNVLLGLGKRKNISEKVYFNASRSLSFANWLNGFSFLINIFLILSLVFLSVSFSEHTYGLNGLAFVIYGFIGLITLWILLLAYLAIRKDNDHEIVLN